MWKDSFRALLKQWTFGNFHATGYTVGALQGKEKFTTHSRHLATTKANNDTTRARHAG